MSPTTRLTFLLFLLNSLLDSGISRDIDETIDRIEDGSVLEWLRNGPDVEWFDLSSYQEEDRRTILELFQSLAAAVDARKKFGVEHNGIALLAAYCVDGLQQLHRQ